MIPDNKQCSIVKNGTDISGRLRWLHECHLFQSEVLVEAVVNSVSRRDRQDMR